MMTLPKAKIFFPIMLLVMMLAAPVLAQKPTITSVDRQSGPFGETITIAGSNFGNNINNIKVFLGAASAPVTFVSDQVIEATVPAGATFHRVSVTNITNGLTAYHSDQFFLSYGGQNGITAADFEAQVDYFAENGLYDLCVCDFNNDGLSEVVTANENSNSLSFFNNSSTIGAISLSKTPLVLGASSININCGDLNGDGKPDLIISEGNNSNKVHIFQNTTVGLAVSFSSIGNVSIPGTFSRRIEINDMDGDGKPELIVSNPGGNTIAIIRNQSTLATISFSPTINTVTIPGAFSTLGLAVEDLNNDGLPEIVTNQFLTNNGNCFVVQNQSTVGNFVFNNVTQLGVAGTIVNVKVGDIDGDGKSDIVATQLLNSTMTIFLNQSSTAGPISFGGFQNFSVPNRAWGLDFGDMDGDGKKDIIIGSIGSQKSIAIMNNNSTPGNLSFIQTEITTTYINRNVKVSDIDGDAKPDILFTSIDDTNLGVFSSELSILRNRQCFVPEITNDDPFTICSNTSGRLFSTETPGATYQWQRNADAPIVTTDPFFDATLGGSYTVTAISESGTCTETSAPINVVIDASSAPSSITLNANSPTCLGQTLNLTASNISGATYSWTGPNSFTSSQQNPSIPNFNLNMVGIYSVTATVGNCTSDEFTILVEATDSPNPIISNSGESTFCTGGSTQLSVTSAPSYTYVWKRDGAIIAGATSYTYNVTTSGSYTAEVTDTNNMTCGAIETSAIDITVLNLPSASFTADASACAGDAVTFTNTSTVDGSATVNYSWNFGDGATSTSQNPTHTYTGSGNYTVSLIVSYAGLTSCSDNYATSIDVIDNSSLTITTSTGGQVICEGGSLTLEVPDTYNAYLWNTGATTPTIQVNTEGTYSVEATTAAGCRSNAEIDILLNDGSGVTIVADRTIIKEGESLQLTVTGLATFVWDDDEFIDDINAISPIVNPIETTMYSVSGIDENGCDGEASIVIEVQEGKTTDKINPHKLFSPNNDNIDDEWIIDEILNYPNCNITLFDQKGVKIYEAKPYLNTWDATYNGRILPQGVYYYVINCGGKDDQKAGSITVIR